MMALFSPVKALTGEMRSKALPKPAGNLTNISKENRRMGQTVIDMS